jgi:hypothetical protein
VKPNKVSHSFVDAMMDAPGDTLNRFTQDYSDKKVTKREKRFFQYDVIHTDNYKKYFIY